MTAHDKTLRKPAALIAAGLAAPEGLGTLEAVAARYAIALTPDVTALIDPSDPHDAIARQFLPDARELHALPEERADPIGDDAHSPVPGIVHRYHDRLLLKIVSVCPVYCRFCFRREMVGPSKAQMLSEDDLTRAFAYIAADPQIGEVIVTGGDPLILSPRRIGELTRSLAAIAHVSKIRWHSRVPVVDPARITPALCAALKADDITPIIAVHANHPRELSSRAVAALASLNKAGIKLLSQSVLLKSVNADAAILAELMRGFTAAGVAPYYLHHGDLAPGTGHFRTSIAEGLAIVQALRGLLPAPLLPRYVLDIPGGYGKVDVAGGRASGGRDGSYTFTDRHGRQHVYPPLTEEAPRPPGPHP